MIEVEVRGRLDEKQLQQLSSFLEQNGKLIEDQDREMVLLRGYEGYSKDPIKREVDIRLRNTNGKCEIMVKRKTSEHNVARHEHTLLLQCADLAPVKETLKALGYKEGLWMHRTKKVYVYRDIEWSVVAVPEGMSYFEAELEAKNSQEASAIESRLREECTQLGLHTMDSEEMKEFIYELDAKVNKEISW